MQWRTPDGTLKAVLVSRVPGTTSEGMAFDATGNTGTPSETAVDVRVSQGAR